MELILLSLQGLPKSFKLWEKELFQKVEVQFDGDIIVKPFRNE